MEDAGILYGHLAHFTVFCYILWTFDIHILRSFWYIFLVLVFCAEKKSGNSGPYVGMMETCN
jgi:hypothetical protein